MLTDPRHRVIESDGGYSAVVGRELRPGMGENNESFDPEWRPAKQVRDSLAEAIAHREDVALDLCGRITDVGVVPSAGSPNFGPVPGAVRRTFDLPGHGLGLEQEHTRRANHQMVDVTGAARQLEAIDQDEIGREVTRQHLTDVPLARKAHHELRVSFARPRPWPAMFAPSRPPVHEPDLETQRRADEQTGPERNGLRARNHEAR